MKKTTTLFIALVATIGLSSNVNAQWVQANTGLTQNNVNSIAGSGANVFAGTDMGLFKSSDDGATWTVVSDTNLTGRDVKQVIINGSNIFAATYSNGVFKSTDNGSTWTSVNGSFTSLGGGYYCCALAVIGNTIYAGMDFDALYSSTDNGATWTKSTSNAIKDATINSIVASGPNLLAASNGCGAAGGGKVYLSNDNGVNWTVSAIDDRSSGSLAVIGGVVFASTKDGVMKSSDNGVTWTTTGATVDNSTSLAVVGTTLVVGTPFGVYKTNDNGTTWVDISAGAGASNLFTQTLGASATNIFAGTMFKTVGIWRRPLSEVGTVTGINNVAIQQGLTVSPNPSANGIFNVALNNTASLTVINLLGETVHTEKASASNHTLDLSHLSAGIYLLQLVDGSHVSTQRIVIQK